MQKIIFCVLFLCSITTVQPYTFRQRTKSLAEGFEAIAEALTATEREISMFNFKGKRSLLGDDIMRAAFKAKMSCHLKNFNNSKDQEYFDFTRSSIMLFDSVVSFKKERKWTTKKVPNEIFLYIHFESATLKEIVKVGFMEFPHQFSYFLVEEDDVIRLMTFLWFTPEKCSEPQLVEINKFDRRMKKWHSDVFRIKKFRNFHGCTLNFLFGEGQPEYQVDEVKVEGGSVIVKKCQGYVCKIAEDVKKSLNFSFVSYSEVDRSRTMIHFQWDVTQLNAVWQHYEESRDFKRIASCMRPIKAAEQFIVITPGEEYDGYEKLLLPFDEETWFFIIFTFGVAFTTVFVASFSQNLRNLVFGVNVPTPAMNVVRALFGISQEQMPTRNFARFILILLLLYTLIIRTCFQGKMFEFLQKDMRKPTLDTVEELIENNYTFYMPYGFKTYYRETEIAKR